MPDSYSGKKGQIEVKGPVTRWEPRPRWPSSLYSLIRRSQSSESVLPQQLFCPSPSPPVGLTHGQQGRPVRSAGEGSFPQIPFDESGTWAAPRLGRRSCQALHRAEPFFGPRLWILGHAPAVQSLLRPLGVQPAPWQATPPMSSRRPEAPPLALSALPLLCALPLASLARLPLRGLLAGKCSSGGNSSCRKSGFLQIQARFRVRTRGREPQLWSLGRLPLVKLRPSV